MSNYSKKMFKQIIFVIFRLKANPPLIRPHKPIKTAKPELEQVSLGLHFVVSSQHFINGRLKVNILYSFTYTRSQLYTLPFYVVLPRIHYSFFVKLIEWEKVLLFYSAVVCWEEEILLFNFSTFPLSSLQSSHSTHTHTHIIEWCGLPSSNLN